jgi:DNA-binding MarR family transcriptional regulator
MEPQDLKHVRLCAAGNLRRTTRALTQLYDELLQPSGLRATQFSLLVNIGREGQATIGRLSETMIIDRTTLTRNLRVLEKDGLIETAPGADQRTHPVRLSQKGKRALARALPYWEQAQSRIVAGLGEEKFRALLRDLYTLAELAQQEVPADRSARAA